MKAITKRLRVLRAQAGLNQFQVSKRSGLNITIYGQIERGFRTPDTSELEAIAKALRVEPTEIVPAPAAQPESVQANG